MTFVIFKGGDVWVLVIKLARPSDSGTYICEINSNPILRSFHTLYGELHFLNAMIFSLLIINYILLSRWTTVVPNNLQPPINVKPTSDGSSATTEETSAQVANHNYTDCCTKSNVTSACMGFCSLKNILDGTTGQEPEQCEADFPSIVKCMAGKIILNLPTFFYLFSL